jgi:pyruvate/2-oxoglutarate dehydrogenase complex dihydrolipoamide acyltransferase (E2) component
MIRAPRNVRRPLLAGTAVAVLALVAACGGGQDAADDPTTATSAPSATPAPSATATPEPSAPSADDAEADAAAPAFPADTAVDTADASADAALTVTDVRVGHHDGFDRVVLELGGTGTPGWRVEYVDAAVEDPSDTAVDLTGDSVLQIMVNGTRLPYETGLTEFTTRQPVTAPGTTAVTEAVFLGTFEAQSQALVGVAGEPAPFRAYLLADPVRLVVDVQG